MSKWSRSLPWIVASGVGLFAYVWFFGIQTLFAVETRYEGRKVPILNSVPVALEDLSISNAHGEKLSFYGAELEVPWKDVDEEKTRTVGNMLAIYFRSGDSILLCVSPADGFIKGLSREKNIDPQLFAQIYGPQVLRSDYALQKAIFETTPAQITPFTTRSRAAGLMSITIVKAIMPPTSDWGIYNIASNEFKGFQLGNPARHPRRMCLELYRDDAHFEIVIDQNIAGSNQAITQAELNRIIQTTHKTASAPSTFTMKPA